MSYDVILATYCGERYIREQVTSILSQTIPPSQIIIRDDCSTDLTLEILKEIKNKTDVSIQIIAGKDNLGYIKNFEELARHTKSEIIFFSDQDDLWVENKAEILLSVFSENINSKVLFSDATLVNNDLMRLGSLWEYVGFNASEDCNNLRNIINNIATGATMAVRKQYLDSVLPFPSQIPHDYWIASNACIGGNLKAVPNELILYRQHENNQIGAKKNSFFGKCNTLFNSAKRKKRIEHYYEIYILMQELAKRDKINHWVEDYNEILEYIYCVNVIYKNKIINNDDKTSVWSALFNSSYIKYSTKKHYFLGLLDGFFLRIK